MPWISFALDFDLFVDCLQCAVINKFPFRNIDYSGEQWIIDDTFQFRKAWMAGTMKTLFWIKSKQSSVCFFCVPFDSHQLSWEIDRLFHVFSISILQLDPVKILQNALDFCLISSLFSEHLSCGVQIACTAEINHVYSLLTARVVYK